MAKDSYLLSYPPVARNNYIFKMSALGGRFLVVADHLLEPGKFFIRYFSDVDTAAEYLDFIIEKERRNGNKY